MYLKPLNINLLEVNESLNHKCEFLYLVIIDKN